MGFMPLKDQSGASVILETDFFTDCDDVAALALLCDEACRHAGAFSLAGVAANVNHHQIPAAIRAVLARYGMGDVPVAMWPEGQPWGYDSKYIGALAALAPDGPSGHVGGLEFYRRVLRAVPDSSLTIVSIGFFNGLAAALRDDPALFHRKVARVIAMAGGFGRKCDHCEYNVVGHLGASREFIGNFKGEIDFVGFECGDLAMTDLTGLPEDRGNFLLEAFRLRSNENMRHPSWDPITVDFAVNGECDCWRLSEPGRVEVDGEGRTLFTASADGNSCHLVFTMSDAAAGARISGDVRRAARLG